jgi:hypothetical protein
MSGTLDPTNRELLELVRAKVAVSAAVGEDVDVSQARFDSVRRQIETDLRPVLRERDLDRAFDVARRVAKAIAA